MPKHEGITGIEAKKQKENDEHGRMENLGALVETLEATEHRHRFSRECGGKGSHDPKVKKFLAAFKPRPIRHHKNCEDALCWCSCHLKHKHWPGQAKYKTGIVICGLCEETYHYENTRSGHLIKKGWLFISQGELSSTATLPGWVCPNCLKYDKDAKLLP